MISIIVPVYNVEKYLIRCINSILEQDFQNFELILVDDGSQDNCGEICDKYAKQDKRIVVIHKSNGGLSDARNAGLEIARGDYIGFVDSDDFIDHEMYSVLYKNIIAYSADISMCGYFDVTENRDGGQTYCKKREIYEWDRKTTIEKVLMNKKVGPHAVTKLYKRSIFTNLRYPVGNVSEDTYIIMDILNLVNNAVFEEAPLYYYFHHQDSINTSNFNSCDLTRFEAYDKMYTYVSKNYPDLLHLVTDNQVKECFFVGRKILLSEDWEKYRKTLKDICKFVRGHMRFVFIEPYFSNKRINYIIFAVLPYFYRGLLLFKYKKICKNI